MKINRLIYVVIIILLFNFSLFADIKQQEEVANLITEIDIMLINYNSSLDKTINEKLIKLNELSGYDIQIKSKFLGLTGFLKAKKNNILLVKKYIKDIEALNKKEEFLYILNAELENDIFKKEKILYKGIKKANPNYRIKLYTADYHFDNGEYKKAVDLYDETLFILSNRYNDIYAKKRNLAFALINDPPKNNYSATIFLKNEITTYDLVYIVIYESNNLLDEYKEKIVSIDNIIGKLIMDGYFYYKDIDLNYKIKRKDLAFFIIKIMIDKENQLEDILIKNNQDSFINDISRNDYYYNAVIMLLEREIMDLPDGNNFFPENFITGLDCYKIIKNLDSWY